MKQRRLQMIKYKNNKKAKRREYNIGEKRKGQRGDLLFEKVYQNTPHYWAEKKMQFCFL